jgi:outer membrane protein assembly factor BamB
VVALIDLGEDRATAVRRGWPAGRSRNRRAVAVLAACVMVLSGPPAAAAGRLVAVATVPAVDPSAVLLTESSLFVADTAGHRVSAYALPSGDVRWRATLADPVGAVRWIADTRVLMASVSGAEPDEGGVYALDADTGRRLWTQPGAVALDAPPGGRLLLQRHTSAGTVDLRWVDARTGELVWDRPITALADVAFAHDPARPGPGGLLVTDADGTAHLLAEDTGTVVVRGQVGSPGYLVLTPGSVAAPDPPGRANRRGGGASDPAPLVAGPTGAQVLVQRRRDSADWSLTAYDINTLTPRWSLLGKILGTPFSCAGLLCLGISQGLRALNPVTGSFAWSTGAWQSASILHGRWLLAATAGGDRHQLAILDARTGRLLRDLHEAWTWVIGAGSDAPVLVRTTERFGGYWLARLSVDPVAVRSIGPLTDIDPASCQLMSPMLACRTRHHQINVWRLYP